MNTQKKQLFNHIYKIKGVSWMLKSYANTSSPVSTNSSHIDQHFKIFKLKDQKKKWKKKINKKFQTVGQKIQDIIKSKYMYKQPFDINFKKQPDLKHTPHLKEIKNLHKSIQIPKNTQKYNTVHNSQTNKKLQNKPKQTPNLQKIPSFFQNQAQIQKRFFCGDNKNPKNSKQSSQRSFQQFKRPFTEQNQNNNNSKKESTVRNSYHESFRLSMKKPKTFHHNQLYKQEEILNLKKVLTQTKGQNRKVTKAKNLLRIHQKQKKMMDKQNQQFFQKQVNWINSKTQSFKSFNIREHQQQIILQRCKQQQKK